MPHLTRLDHAAADVARSSASAVRSLRRDISRLGAIVIALRALLRPEGNTARILCGLHRCGAFATGDTDTPTHNPNIALLARTAAALRSGDPIQLHDLRAGVTALRAAFGGAFPPGEVFG